MPAKGKWGGPRRGAGRKPETDSGEVRRNRVTFTLTDTELDQLKALAEKRDPPLPLGTLAYEYITKAMRRAK